MDNTTSKTSIDVPENQHMSSEYDLRDTVLKASELNKGVVFSGGTFRRYGDGVWKEAHDLAVRQIVAETLESLGHRTSLSLSRSTESNVTDLIKSKTYVEVNQWDKHPEILVFRNCSLDTRTSKVLDHSPEHKATISLPYEYDPDAKAPTIQKVLNDLLTEDEQRFFQEFAGYCLTTSTKHQMALWLTGPRGGGKSTLIAILETMLGHLAGHLSLSQMGKDFGLAGIVGKTLLTCSETPKQHMRATDTLNALVTGDMLTVNIKHRPAFDHNNTAKLVWAMNSLPNLFDADNGLFRRVKVLEIGKSIPENQRDPNIIGNIRTEGAGIINWALNGLARLNERDRFQYPKSVIQATESYKQENDLPAQFLEECCERAPSEQLFFTDEFKVYAGQLTDAFNTWARGHRDWSTKSLKQEWERLNLKQNKDSNGKSKRDKHGIAWYGVRLV